MKNDSSAVKTLFCHDDFANENIGITKSDHKYLKTKEALRKGVELFYYIVFTLLIYYKTTDLFPKHSNNIVLYYVLIVFIVFIQSAAIRNIVGLLFFEMTPRLAIIIIFSIVPAWLADQAILLIIPYSLPGQGTGLFIIIIATISLLSVRSGLYEKNDFWPNAPTLILFIRICEILGFSVLFSGIILLAGVYLDAPNKFPPLHWLGLFFVGSVILCTIIGKILALLFCLIGKYLKYEERLENIRTKFANSKMHTDTGNYTEAIKIYYDLLKIKNNSINIKLYNDNTYIFLAGTNFFTLLSYIKENDMGELYCRNMLSKLRWRRDPFFRAIRFSVLVSYFGFLLGQGANENAEKLVRLVRKIESLKRTHYLYLGIFVPVFERPPHPNEQQIVHNAMNTYMTTFRIMAQELLLSNDEKIRSLCDRMLKDVFGEGRATLFSDPEGAAIFDSPTSNEKFNSFKEEYFQSQIQKYEAESKTFGVAFFHNELGNLYAEEENGTSDLERRMTAAKGAVDQYMRALEVNAVADKEHTFAPASAFAGSWLNPNTAIGSYKGLGELYAMRSRKVSKPEPLLDLSKEYILKAIDIIERQRVDLKKLYTWGPNHSLYLRNYAHLFHMLIEVNIQKGCLWDAFIALERTKSRTLLDVFFLRSDFYAEQRSLSDRCVSAVSEVKTGTPYKFRWIEAYEEFVGRAHDFQNSSNNAVDLNPDYLLSHKKIIKEIIGDHTAIIEFVCSGTLKSDYIFIISSSRLSIDHSHLAEFASDEDLWLHLLKLERDWGDPRAMNQGADSLEAVARDWEDSYRDFRSRSMKDRWNQQMKALLLRLSEVIRWPQIHDAVKHSRQTIDRLILVPHSHLYNLPLHALPTQDRSGADRRLIDDFSVAYISSTAVLVASHLRREDRNPSLPDHPFMGIASKAKVRSRTQRRNVRMDEELRAIVKHLPAEFEPLLHVGKTSGVDEIAEIFEKMQGAQHIHFSCHGQFDFEVPVRSTLDILPKRKRSLTALEVFCFGHLPLCDSVFLSACETGRMRTSVIDENLGLTTAFLQSGANSVIATLWLSEYDASVQFSESFYRHAFLDENNISGEHTIFDAFTAAQREYREKSGEDLSVWAPFVYYGTI